jgi:GWxTD domain-containing protein
MRHWMLLAGLAGLGGVGAPARPAQVGDGLTVRAFRFYRPDAGETLVTGLIEIPYGLLTPSGAGHRSGEVSVVVRDSAGLELNRSAWPVAAAASMPDSAASLLEIVEFKLHPGRYDLDVAVLDSSTGRSTTQTVSITAFPAPPEASDIVLAPSIRLVGGADTALAPGERRWGGVVLTPTPHLVLTPVRSKAFYMLEVYPAHDTTVTMTAAVIDSAGRTLLTTRPRQVAVSAAGAVLNGQVDLAGLPAGDYRLTVSLDCGGRREQRTDAFEMADFEATMARERTRLEALRVTDEGYFGTMTETQLDEAEAPLQYLASSDSLAVWKTGLSVAGKRQFLTRFWQLRDPTPGTARNENREAFYAAIDQADRDFDEGGRAKVPGWRTDRGRITIRNGPPSDVLDRRISSGTSGPYLVWRYTRGKARYYIFADRTGFGAYKLIATNDLRETGAAGYREMLGGEALQDISRWLGIDLFSGDQGRTAAPPSD